MKLPIFLILLGFVFSLHSAGALPGRSLRPGGSSHLNAIRNAAKGRLVKKLHSELVPRAGWRNRTSHTQHERHASDVKKYPRYTISETVAPYRSPSPSLSKSHYLHKRMPYPSHGLRSSSTRTSSTSLNSAKKNLASPTVLEASNAPAIVPDKTKPLKNLKRLSLNTAPTPAPTAPGSPDTTVHINDEKDFALLLPNRPGELISDAETDGVSFCTSGSCSRTLPEGFITAAAVSRAPDNSWIQVTGCIDPSKSRLSASDDGGQFDVRFPNGAQCTFGGYGASFIEQVEPSANRFCLRCCATKNDQANCNSHRDREGCIVAMGGTYDFPDKGISCG